MGEDEPRVPPAGGDTLQLDTAEPLDPAVPADTVCRACGTRIERTYFTIGASIACGGCRDAFVHRLASREGESFGRAALFGLGAAAVGSLIYFVVAKVTGYEIALVGILTGYLVGRAVRQGSRSLGGRRYQVLAACLTYVAIVSSYVPPLWQSVTHSSPEAAPSPATSEAAPSRDEQAPAAATPVTPVPRSGERPILLRVVLAVFVFGFALVAPILAGPKNFFGWMIIGLSLWEAWKLTRAVEVPVRGPFRVGADEAPARG